MSKIRSSFILILFAQASCLMIGLWIHQRLTIAISNEANSVATTSKLANVPNLEDTKENPSAAQVEDRRQQGFSLFPSCVTFVWVLILQGVATHFLLHKFESAHENETQKHYHNSLSKTRELLQTRDAVIFGLAQLAESRDSDTGQHLERIALYSNRLANGVRNDPRFSKKASPSFVRLIGISSALHDIGKVAIADSILLKPGPLTESETLSMQCHAEKGAECIEKIEKRLGKCNFLEMAKEIAQSHHEHWDGQGYPNQIYGEEIPLAARIVAIADVYDALRSRRAYKSAMGHDESVEIISRQSGKQFDPAIVEIFLKMKNQFYEISESFGSSPEFQMHDFKMQSIIA
ncbi:HD domain-containing protein [Pirellulaceae bacterium]|nr:HD domain-containing protein [Pirellulaceae bacterium]